MTRINELLLIAVETQKIRIVTVCSKLHSLVQLQKELNVTAELRNIIKLYEKLNSRDSRFHVFTLVFSILVNVQNKGKAEK